MAFITLLVMTLTQWITNYKHTWNQVDFLYFNMGAYCRIVENRTMIVDLADRLLDGLFAGPM